MSRIDFMSTRVYGTFMKPDKLLSTELSKKMIRKFGRATKCQDSNCIGLSTHYLYTLKNLKNQEILLKNFNQICRSCIGKNREYKLSPVVINTNSRTVEVYDPFGDLIGTYPSAQEAGKAFGMSSEKIGKIATGVMNPPSGFSFKFIEKKKDEK